MPVNIADNFPPVCQERYSQQLGVLDPYVSLTVDDRVYLEDSMSLNQQVVDISGIVMPVVTMVEIPSHDIGGIWSNYFYR